MQHEIYATPLVQEPHRFIKRYTNWLAAIFFIFALGLALFARNQAYVATLGITFVSIVLEALPFMLLGTLVGGFIEVFIPRDRISELLPARHAHTILIAAGMGLIFPICECAIVPVIRRLLKKGIPLGAAVAFLLGGPIVNPLVFASTAVAYGYSWETAAGRLLLGYGISVSIGFVMEFMFVTKQALHNHLIDNQPSACRLDSESPRITDSMFHKITQAVDHAADDFMEIGCFLVIGAFGAGLIHVVVSRPALISAMDTPAVAIAMMMGLAILLNLCSETDAFVAATFRFSAIPFSAQMAFMVLGPMLDIKLLLMFMLLFRKKALAVLVGGIIIGVFASALIIEFIGQ